VTDPNPTTEYSAGIEPPEAFDPSTFRSKDLAPGVRAVIGKRPGKDTTETQSIRFDHYQFNKRTAQTWLRKHGYKWRTWGSPDRRTNAAPPPPTPNKCAREWRRPGTTNPSAAQRIRDARTHITEAAAHVQNALDAILWLSMPAAGPAIALFMTLRRTKMALARASSYAADYAAQHPNPADLAGLLLAAGVANKAIGDAIDKSKDNPPPAPAPPRAEAPGAAPTPNPPAPRQLVQIGTARALELVSGRGYRWTVAERWLVLADPGAEKGSRGRLRLFIVAPKGKKESTRAPHKTAERTFETWHSFEPSRTWTMDIPLADEFTTQIGNARSITYRSDKWNHGSAADYIHAFSKAQPPRVSAVGPADRPRALMLDGGRWRLTARGLVD